MWASRAQQSGPDRGRACLLAALLLCFSFLHAQDITPSQTPPPTSNTLPKSVKSGPIQEECKFSEEEAGFCRHAPLPFSWNKGRWKGGHAFTMKAWLRRWSLYRILISSAGSFPLIPRPSVPGQGCALRDVPPSTLFNGSRRKGTPSQKTIAQNNNVLSASAWVSSELCSLS